MSGNFDQPNSGFYDDANYNFAGTEDSLINMYGGGSDAGMGAGTGMGSSMIGMLGSLGGLYLQSEGQSLIAGGADLAASAAIAGGNYSAAVYRSYEQAETAGTNYNVSLAQQQFARQNNSMAQQVQLNTSTNRAIGGSNGLMLNSGSSIAVNSNNLNMAQQQFTQMKNTSTQNIEGIQYEGAMTNTMLENQALGAQYQGQVSATIDQYQGQVASWQAGASMLQGAGQAVGNLLGSL